jgi:prepilin-type N-terminal cleavage/methylation domain-containing protein
MLFLIRHRRNAFTLIELLVVIGIISVLMAISLLIGSRVVSGGKARVTTDTIRVLDSAMSDYVNRVGRIPDSTVRIKTNANAGSTVNLFPVFDAVDTNTEVQINTIGLFIEQGQGTSGIATTIATLNPKFVRSFDPDGPGGPQPELTTVFDGWDRPIRYVHPTFDGRWIQGTRGVGDPGNPVDLTDAAASPIKAQNLRNDLAIRMTRRNFLNDNDREATPGIVGDSDGGTCPSPRPYFYSPGEDGDPSATDDNVYTTKPRIPKE